MLSKVLRHSRVDILYFLCTILPVVYSGKCNRIGDASCQSCLQEGCGFCESHDYCYDTSDVDDGGCPTSCKSCIKPGQSNQCTTLGVWEILAISLAGGIIICCGVGLVVLCISKRRRRRRRHVRTQAVAIPASVIDMQDIELYYPTNQSPSPTSLTNHTTSPTTSSDRCASVDNNFHTSSLAA